MAFCKKNLLLELIQWEQALRKKYNFDHTNGWSQVDGRGEEVNRAYGEWHMVCTSITEIESGELGYGVKLH